MNIDSQPFLSHAFLFGLEKHHCACQETGWIPQHLLIFDVKNQQSLIGGLPCYLKDHSYGEYIFDWSWADAYYRAGISYYPKLSCATPFTPATAPRWLIHPNYRERSLQKKIISSLISFLIQHAKSCGVSSIHALFIPEESNRAFNQQGFITRHSSQFHWKNKDTSQTTSIPKVAENLDEKSPLNGYLHFTDYLNTMSSRKRKNIRRERKRVAEQGVTFKWFTGAELTKEIALQMFSYYLNTIYRYGAQQYLTEEFFIDLSESMSNMTHILLAYQHDMPVAGGLFFSSSNRLYGRYWGAEIDIKDLHFETCYYQPIEYAILNEFEAFEAGAQGKHKLSRGLMPVTTYSQHWIADERFRSAILEFTKSEAEGIYDYNCALSSAGPFRQNPEKTVVEV